MKHIYESIIGRKGTQFSPKYNIQIGDILVQRNGYYWYLQDDMMLIHPNKGEEDMTVYIDDFLAEYDNMLKSIGQCALPDYDIVVIYRSGNTIHNPNYKKINDFINHNNPIWSSRK